MIDFEFSPDQRSAIDALMVWRSNPVDGKISFSGYAGTGKTTVISALRSLLPTSTRIAYCAFSGKAASVLRSKLIKCGIQSYPNDNISTIHSLIYEPPKDEENNPDPEVKWVLKKELSFDLIICDESSMISENIYNDLMSFNIPIIFAGDAGQLPPVEGTLNLMANPIIKLEKVHRFAEHNPLTKISMMARLDGYIPHGTFGEFVHKVPKKHSLITDFINTCGDFSGSAIICGFNKTRIELNQKIRTWHKREGAIPLVGERVICLKNNAQALRCPIYNGVGGKIIEISSAMDHYHARISIDGEDKNFIGKISKNIFNNPSPDMNSEWIMEVPEEEDIDATRRFLKKNNYSKKPRRKYLDAFDFGYVLTCHKSQGSEWERVMVLEQPCSFWAGELWARWLYTAVTRAKTELLIVR
jgi:exodeoxyribonuclease V